MFTCDSRVKAPNFKNLKICEAEQILAYTGMIFFKKMILCTFYFSLRLFADLLTAARLPVGTSGPRASAPQAHALPPVSSTPLPSLARGLRQLRPTRLPPATTPSHCGLQGTQWFHDLASDLRPSSHTALCWRAHWPQAGSCRWKEGSFEKFSSSLQGKK